MTQTIKMASYQEDTYTQELYEIRTDGILIGGASVMVDDKSAYVERIDIDAEHRGQGHGTRALKALAAIYGSIVVAPDSEDSKRLYERLGCDVSEQHWMVDQGYGAYEI